VQKKTYLLILPGDGARHIRREAITAHWYTSRADTEIHAALHSARRENHSVAWRPRIHFALANVPGVVSADLDGELFKTEQDLRALTRWVAEVISVEDEDVPAGTIRFPVPGEKEFARYYKPIGDDEQQKED
jgi:hypothetical protein